MNGFSIGPHKLSNGLLVAPMAGLTDRPTRNLLRNMGAGLAVAEMLTSDTSLWHSRKSQLRLPHADDIGPVSVQIAGNDPQTMAQAAQANVALGADIVDINMGCPAKKVLKKAAGSALLAQPQLVAEILQAVVNAVDVPVTLKIRTGSSPQQRNGVDIAKIAEAAGISALAVHGRTRQCAFKGEVEFDTIAAIKQAVTIPVIANGDISTPEQAQHVLQHTQADGLMIGRAIQGNPWIFQQIHHFLCTQEHLAPASAEATWQVVEQHLIGIHLLYGATMGPRIARKHAAAYLPDRQARMLFNQLNTASEQLTFLQQQLHHQTNHQAA
ncbi:MAG: tRNA dihydrouridine synthase DusB [Gammaproteobacteria bacterium]|nr:tRNA dihydrouridine synthase DusB [Gammaproteobacteria bacterium]MCP4880251.1 tRNA dihydrouridine synthase DusB [Gammaproteobacteria bacterium]